MSEQKIRSSKTSDCPSIDSSFGCPVEPDPRLVAEGWKLRFFGDARMSQDAGETYKSLNFEVRLEPVVSDNMKEECLGCQDSFLHFSMVYTRKV